MQRSNTTVAGLRQLLSNLDATGVPYVSWKNNHELPRVMAGESDLDLFVPLEYRASFISVCRQEGWLEVMNPVARFPWVQHFYRLDENLLLHHVHVYFKMVTGESWLKEYILPIDQWLIENRIRSADYGIWVLNNAAQAYLFVIRHLMKGAAVSSRVLYSLELASYREEWIRCNQDLSDLARIGPIDISSYLLGTGIKKNNFRLPSPWNALRFRLSISPFLRVQWWSLSIRRVVSFWMRFVNKVFLGKKKFLPNGGLVIAISGVDGAGKSTMLKEVDKVFGIFLTVFRFHLGRPQGVLIEFIRRAMGKWNSTAAGSFDKPTSLLCSARKAFSAMVLALLRLRLARVAVKRAEKGHIVLVDRWPTDVVGKMDGPRTVIGEKSGFMVRICGHVESWAYARMPRADICYFFELPVSVAIERNRKRIKEGKESDEEITARFEENLDYHPLARKVVHFDNSGELEVKRKEFLNCVWQEIVSH